MKRILSVLGIVYVHIIFISGCRNGNSQQPEKISRDTAITIKNAFSGLFFDSVRMENYLKQRAVPDTAKQLFRNFYTQRNFQYAWFDSSGLAEQAQNFWSLQSNYIDYSGDSAIYNVYLNRWMDSISSNGVSSLPDSTRLGVEWGLTFQFFRYANRAYSGRRSLNAADLEWFIPRKKANLLSMLDTLVKEKGKEISRYEPVNQQYQLLRNQLKRYYDIERDSAWNPIEINQKKIQLGDSGLIINKIRKRLLLTGDLNSSDTITIFDDTLRQAVKRFQSRYGLAADGILGGSTLRELNKPINDRIRQILVNMERMRWVPEQPKGDYILVNIPEFKAHVYETGKKIFDMEVVVGTTSNNTVIFTGNLKYVVFSPYWNIPPGILKNEVLPAIRRNPSYLERNDMEWYNGGIRQRPGERNPLGLVKFLFPNNYSIYLHDTPSKTLFKQTKRAFSHGCIRISEPVHLAEWLLRADSTWTSERIFSAMHSGKEKYVTLKQSVPVFIGYFTAWVDAEGRLNFRDDIYGHDKKMIKKMFD